MVVGVVDGERSLTPPSVAARRRRVGVVGLAPRLPGRRASSHRADDGDDQQHRRELEREHVVAEQVVGELLDVRCRAPVVGVATAMPSPRALNRLAALQDRWRRADRSGRRRRWPPSGRWTLIGSIAHRLDAVDAEQHDHEQEQHHDRAGVDDDLHGGEEVGVLATNSTATPNRVSDQAQRGVHRMRAGR